LLVTLNVSETSKWSRLYNCRDSFWQSFKVETDTLNAATASYDLILLFTDAEAAQLSGGDLRVIKVNSNSIDDASSSSDNFKISRPTTNVFTDHEYSMYKGTYIDLQSLL
jgi:hypothetical protein